MHPSDMAHVLKMMAESLGETLRVERYRRGLSIHLVSSEAQSLGLSMTDTAFSSWERQERWPSRESCQAISVWLSYSAGQPTVAKATTLPATTSMVRLVMTTLSYQADLVVPGVLTAQLKANGGPPPT